MISRPRPHVVLTSPVVVYSTTAAVTRDFLSCWLQRVRLAARAVSDTLASAGLQRRGLSCCSADVKDVNLRVAARTSTTKDKAIAWRDAAKTAHAAIGTTNSSAHEVGSLPVVLLSESPSDVVAASLLLYL